MFVTSILLPKTFIIILLLLFIINIIISIIVVVIIVFIVIVIIIYVYGPAQMLFSSFLFTCCFWHVGEGC